MYFGIDVTAVRIGFVVLAVLGGSAVPLYAAGWLLIPEAGAELSIGQGLFNNLRHRGLIRPCSPVRGRRIAGGPTRV